MKRTFLLLPVLCLAWPVQAAGAGDLGAPEWPGGTHRECVVLATLGTPTAHEFHAAFARHWCLQGWAATTLLSLREAPPARWSTRVDVLRDGDVLATVPMSPWVEQHLDQVAAAVVSQVAAVLMQSDRDPAADGEFSAPAMNRPGGERK